MTKRAGIYARISRDRVGAGLGIERQTEDGRALAARLGLVVAVEHADNDLSAYSGKPRPGYAALLADIEAGRIDVVIAWHTDRLHRSPVELEAYITSCERRNIPTHTVTAGPVDLATPSGRLTARQLGAVARYEVEHAVERQQRAKLQAATAGRWGGGRRPYGYAEDGVTVVPAEADVLREASEAVLNGSSLRSIATDLNRRGVPTSTGKPWRQDTARRVLLRPRNAGLREHRGKVLGPAGWTAVVPEDTWRAVVAVLTDPGRRTSPGSVRRWLGSGIYRCGVCGAVMRCTSDGGGSSYACTAAKHLTRRSVPVDQFVTEVVTGHLARLTLPERPAPDTAPLRARAVELRGRLDGLARVFARGGISEAQLEAGTGEVRAELEQTEVALAAGARRSPLVGLAGAEDIEARWSALPLERRQAVISALATVTILPTSRRGRQPFDPGCVRIEWRG